MTEREFQELLIEMIRRSNYAKRIEIADILERSAIVFDKTYEFTRHKWNHYKEYIYITATPADMMELIKHKKFIDEVIEKIYPVNDDYEYELWGVEIKPGKISDNEFVSQEILFEDIQRQIIEEIRAAKYTIWIAMAWFTNKTIFDELLKKKKQGINVQVVIDDNDVNRNTVFRLEDHFETHRISVQSRYKNLMHL